jgi:hypothetical protein
MQVLKEAGFDINKIKLLNEDEKQQMIQSLEIEAKLAEIQAHTDKTNRFMIYPED